MRRVLLYCVTAACLFWIGTSAWGEDPAAGSQASSNSTAAQTAADEGTTISDILFAGGPVGIVILLLSIGAVSLVIEHVMTIRADVLMPPELGDEVRELLSSGRLADARQRCHGQPSFLAFVLGAGLAEVEGGWTAVEKAVEDSTADQSARLFRKIEYLSVIGNIAPMLGLLGTVIGMIFAFHQVAETQGAARAGDLAEGIYLALVTTVEGLIVAIPALAAFAVFRNRVDQLVAEVAYSAQHTLTPLKRSYRHRAAAAPVTGQPRPAPRPSPQGDATGGSAPQEG